MRGISAAALGFTFLAFGGITHALAHRTVEPLWVDLSADGLTVYAEEVPLRSVLEEVGRVTGIRIRLDEHDSRKLTVAFEDIPVEDGLRRLLRGKSFFMVSGPLGSVDEANVLKGTRTPIGARVERLAAGADTQEATDAWIEVLQRESNPQLVERALDIVGQNPATPLDVVTKLALRSPEPRVRIKALTYLTEHGVGDPRVRDTLETVAADDPAAEVRRVARRLLGSLTRP